MIYAKFRENYAILIINIHLLKHFHGFIFLMLKF